MASVTLCFKEGPVWIFHCSHIECRTISRQQVNVLTVMHVCAGQMFAAVRLFTCRRELHECKI